MISFLIGYFCIKFIINDFYNKNFSIRTKPFDYNCVEYLKSKFIGIYPIVYYYQVKQEMEGSTDKASLLFVSCICSLMWAI